MVFGNELNERGKDDGRMWGRCAATRALMVAAAVTGSLAMTGPVAAQSGPPGSAAQRPAAGATGPVAGATGPAAGAQIPAAGAGQSVPAGSGAQLPERRSSLPREALLRAREAEQHLAANAPEKAIEILRGLDREHPRQPALSLRLAEIYDTMGRHAHALFFYRRYVAQAGDRARPIAVERVASLELMAGVPEQVEQQVEREFGEDTRPVATPTPRVERMLATRAQDGGLVPIRNEQDLKKLEREGVPEKSPEPPLPMASNTPIVLPSPVNRSVAAPDNAARARDASSDQRRDAAATLRDSWEGGVVSDQRRDAAATLGDAAATLGDAAGTLGDASAPGRESNRAASPVTDEDALLAQAFRKSEETPQTGEGAEHDGADSDDAVDASTGLEVSAVDLAPKVSGDLTSLPRSTSRSSRSGSTVVSDAGGGQASGNTAAAGRRSHTGAGPSVSPRLTPVPDQRQVVFTSPTPTFSSARAAGFFHVTQTQGQYALVSLINDIPSAVVTLTITPRDDGEVMSAILATSEQKRVYVRPGSYDVMANVSTTDYSPITLMNTHFDYTFSAGQQYTRRFNKNNIQQLN